MLSPSTEEFDRNEKFAIYAAIASVEELVLIDSQPRYGIEIYRRNAAGTLIKADTADGLDLNSLDFSMQRDAVLAGL